MFNRGTIEWPGGRSYIDYITIVNGGFHVSSHALGPFSPYVGPASIYGSDGQLLLHGGHIEVPEVADHEELNLPLDMTLETMEAS